MSSDDILNLGGVTHRIDRAKIRDVLARLRAADPDAGTMDLVGGAFEGTGMLTAGPPAEDRSERPEDLRPTRDDGQD